MIPDKAHVLPVRVYYEDTDAAGMVYHSAYLRFAERGRTEWLRQLGVNQQSLSAGSGIRFVVAKLQIVYLKPAGLDDMLLVETVLEAHHRVSALFLQNIFRATRDDKNLLARLNVKIASIDRAGRLTAHNLRH